LTIIAVLCPAYRLTLHFIVEAKLNEIRNQGFPVIPAELDEWYPQVPKEENAADIFTRAFANPNRCWGTNSIDQSASSITNQRPCWREVTERMQHQLLPAVGKAKLPQEVRRCRRK